MLYEIVLALLLVAVVAGWYLFEPPAAIKDLPAVPLLPMLWLAMKRAPVDIRDAFIREHVQGHTMYRMFVQGNWVVVLTTAKDIKSVLLRAETFPKNLVPLKYPRSVLARFVGSSLFISNGSMWQRQRHIANPAFRHGWKTTAFGDTGLTLVQELAKVDAQPINIHVWMQRLTLDVLGKIIFEFDFGALKQLRFNKYVDLYNEVIEGAFHPLWLFFPWLSQLNILPIVRTLKAKIAEFDTFLYTMIDDRKRRLEEEVDLQAAKQGTLDLEKDGPQDLLGRMILANSLARDAGADAKHQDYLSDKELRDNVMTFFVAGHDTTAHSLAAVLYLLSKHPAAQERAVQEVRAVLGQPSATEPAYPTLEEQNAMPYLTAVIKEALRIYPSVSFIGARVASKDVSVADRSFPAGTLFMMNIFGSHRSATNWAAHEAHERVAKDTADTDTDALPDEPPVDAFNPDRFLDQMTVIDTAKDLSSGEGISASMSGKTGFLAFGYGPRACLGMNFSLIEQRVILALLLQKYVWTLPADSPHQDRLLLRSMNLLAPKDLYLVATPRTV